MQELLKLEDLKELCRDLSSKNGRVDGATDEGPNHRNSGMPTAVQGFD